MMKRLGAMLALLTALIYLAALLGLAACGGPRLASPGGSAGPGIARPSVPDQPTTPQHPTAPPRPILPGFPPGESQSSPAPRQISDSTLALDGVDFAEQSAVSASYADPTDPMAYALVPADGESLAWAHYAFSGIMLEKPVSVSINLSSALQAPGGAALPLRCWIAVANYTQAYWQWAGPYTQAGTVDLALNTPAGSGPPPLCDRYLSASGGCHVLVLTAASEEPAGPGNPDGLCAARVLSVAVNTSASYQTNKPHYAAITSLTIGAAAKGGSAAARGASSLQPSQFVYLAWDAVAPLSPADFANTAQSYLVYRQGPLDATPLQIGATPGTAFLDPLDRDAGVAEPQSGVQYVYFLRAQNLAGQTPLARAQPLVIPILPPDAISAGLDDPSGTLHLAWSAADGAQAFQVWRADTADTGQAALLERLAAPALSYDDLSAEPGQAYWYWIKAEGLGDGDAANGLEPGALSAFSLGAHGLRRVLLSLQCVSAGVAGDGSAAQPYQLASGTSYQFAALDQAGVDLTADATWTVEPPESATFSGATQGLLESIVAGPLSFTITATYGLAEYIWSASADCAVN